MAKVIGRIEILNKYVEFHDKNGAYRIGKVKKVGRKYISIAPIIKKVTKWIPEYNKESSIPIPTGRYIEITIRKPNIRVTKDRIIGQITHSGLRREIDWSKP